MEGGWRTRGGHRVGKAHPTPARGAMVGERGRGVRHRLASSQGGGQVKPSPSDVGAHSPGGTGNALDATAVPAQTAEKAPGATSLAQEGPGQIAHVRGSSRESAGDVPTASLSSAGHPILVLTTRGLDMRPAFHLGRRAKILGICLTFLGALAAGAATAAIGEPPTGSEDVYPKNAEGDTFGKMPTEGGIEQLPDLVAVVGIHGKTGYARAEDLGVAAEPPSSPEEAVRQQQARSADREIPVYAEDGATIVDTFIVHGTPGVIPPPPDTG